MKRVVSKLLTLLLTVSMIVTFMPAMAFADDEVPDASEPAAVQEEKEEVAEEAPEAEENTQSVDESQVFEQSETDQEDTTADMQAEGLSKSDFPSISIKEDEYDDIDTEIAYATITIPVPIENEQYGPDTPTSKEHWSSLQPNITVPKGANFSVKFRSWVADKNKTDLATSYYFHANTKYYLWVILEADDGYTFASNTTVTDTNGATCETTPEVATVDGKSTLSFVMGVTAQERVTQSIEEVVIDVTTPDAGTKVKDVSFYGSTDKIKIENDDIYKVMVTEIQQYHSIHWKLATSGDDLDNDYELKAGETYYVGLYFRTNTYDYVLTDNTKVTINGTDAELYSKGSVGTVQAYTTLFPIIKVTLPDPSLHSITGLNCTADKSKARENDEVTFTADDTAVKAAYPDADSIEVTGWKVGDEDWVSSTDTTKTVTMPDNDLTVMARYKVTQDTSEDVSYVEVKRDLNLTEKTGPSGIYSGEVYDKKSNTTADKAGVADEPAVSLLAEAEAAMVAKIREHTSEDYNENVVNTTTEILNTEKPDAVTSYYDKDGTAVEASGDYTVELVKTEGDYGKQYKYTSVYTVTYEKTCGLTISSDTNGSVSFTEKKYDGTSGEGGSTKGSYIVLNNSKITLEATANEGYEFVGWYEAKDEADTIQPTDALLSADPEYSWYITKNTVVYARFAELNTISFTYDLGSGHEDLAEKVFAAYKDEDFGDDFDKTSAKREGSKLTLLFPAKENGDFITIDYVNNELSGFTWDAIDSDSSIPMDQGKAFYGVASKASYSSEKEYVNDRQSEDGKILDVGHTFYAIWAAPIKSVNVTVTAPVCGTEVTVSGSDQSPQPSVKVSGKECAVRKGYSFYTHDEGEEQAWWLTRTDEGYLEQFEGTFQGGEEYTVGAVLAASFGYFFNPEEPPKVTVNGTTLTYEEDFECGYGTMLDFTADVEAEHDWGDWKVIKKATTTATGLKERKCKHCEKFEQKVIPKLSVTKTVLVAKAKAKGKRKGVISWNNVKADRYVIYMAKCNFNTSKYKLKKVKTVSGKKLKYTTKKLKKNKCYKFKVVAQKKVNGKYKNIATSYEGHFCTGNVRGSVTNPKSMKLNKTKVTLKKGGTVKLSAKVTKVKKSKKLATTHCKLLRYKSNNPTVATVSASGKVTAKSAGTATIYVQTINGMWKTCKVTVK